MGVLLGAKVVLASSLWSINPMKYARLSTENTVIEVFTPPQGFALAECFTAELVAQFEPCPDDVEQSWIKQDDGMFVAPPQITEPEPPPGDETR